MLYGKIVRCRMPMQVVSIDTSVAEKMPG